MRSRFANKDGLTPHPLRPLLEREGTGTLSSLAVNGQRPTVNARFASYTGRQLSTVNGQHAARR
jgi:hypothetical protein